MYECPFRTTEIRWCLRESGPIFSSLCGGGSAFIIQRTLFLWHSLLPYLCPLWKGVSNFCHNDELSSSLSWNDFLLTDSDVFILFAENSQILLKISVTPVLLNCTLTILHIIRPLRWAKSAVLPMYCRFGYRTVRLIELYEYYVVTSGMAQGLKIWIGK